MAAYANYGYSSRVLAKGGEFVAVCSPLTAECVALGPDALIAHYAPHPVALGWVGFGLMAAAAEGCASNPPAGGDAALECVVPIARYLKDVHFCRNVSRVCLYAAQLSSDTDVVIKRIGEALDLYNHWKGTHPVGGSEFCHDVAEVLMDRGNPQPAMHILRGALGRYELDDRCATLLLSRAVRCAVEIDDIEAFVELADRLLEYEDEISLVTARRMHDAAVRALILDRGNDGSTVRDGRFVDRFAALIEERGGTAQNSTPVERVTAVLGFWTNDDFQGLVDYVDQLNVDLSDAVTLENVSGITCVGFRARALVRLDRMEETEESIRRFRIMGENPQFLLYVSRACTDYGIAADDGGDPTGHDILNETFDRLRSRARELNETAPDTSDLAECYEMLARISEYRRDFDAAGSYDEQAGHVRRRFSR